MLNLIPKAIGSVSSLLKRVQVKSFLATVFVGLILLTSGFNGASSNQAANNISSKVFESNSERPTTTREWYQKARETEDAPGERLSEIGKESAQAIKEFGKLYPDTAERTAPDALKDS